MMKDIPGYEGLYAVTDDGQVYSHRRGKFLSLRTSKKGYLDVLLSKGGNQKRFSVHRLVCEAFVPNPDNLPEVNHLSEDKADNRKENLCWVSHAENMQWGTHTRHGCKAVYCVELDRVFESQTVAAKELGLHSNSIGRCCNGSLSTPGGYHWRRVGNE